MNFVGTAGNDVRNGTPDADVFNLTQGGNDEAKGFAGNDLFLFGSQFNALDKIDGGTGDDVLMLNGNYSAGVVFGPETLVRVQTIQLGGNFSYSFTTHNATIPGLGSLTIDARALVAGRSLTFNGAGETTGFFEIIGGRGADLLTGGLNGDVFDLSRGGNDTASGGGGDDSFFLGGRLNAGDRIDGGEGWDELGLAGPTYAAGVTLAANTLRNVETILFDAGFSYRLTAVGDSVVASGRTLIVGAGTLGPGDRIDFSVADETSKVKFVGGAGNDVFTGGAANDLFDLRKGGSDFARGGDGNDVFVLGAKFTTSDRIAGGADPVNFGRDVITLQGDYSSGLTFNANTVRGVESIRVVGRNDFKLVTHDATVDAGERLFVGTSGIINFDGSAETDGSFSVSGRAGGRVTGGAGDDVFNLDMFTPASIINGGAGDDTAEILGKGPGPIIFNALTMRSVETLDLRGTSARIVSHNATVAAGQTLAVINGRDFDGSAELDGRFEFLDIGHPSRLTGGQGDDLFYGRYGADILAGGGGADTFKYFGAPGGDDGDEADSDLVGDIINAFDFTEDVIQFRTVTAIDAAVNTGSLSVATFDADLAAAIGAAQLGVHHAVLFRPDEGDLAGKRFLIVDSDHAFNGANAGYQKNADLVIRLNGALNLGSIGIEDFIV